MKWRSWSGFIKLTDRIRFHSSWDCGHEHARLILTYRSLTATPGSLFVDSMGLRSADSEVRIKRERYGGTLCRNLRGTPPECETAAIVACLVSAHYNAPRGAYLWIVANFLALQRL